MSGRMSRPRRTKMYDCNYNMSERYYKPMVDHLDRKYSTAPSLDREIRDIPRHFSPLADGRRRDKSPLDMDAAAAAARRRPMSAMIEDLDDDAGRRASTMRFDRASRAAAAAAEDALAEDEMAASMKRIQASRAARAALEDEISEISAMRSQRKAPLDYSEKMFDSLGMHSGTSIEKARVALEEEPFFKKRVMKMSLLDEEDEGAGTLTKWTALKGGRRGNDDLVDSETTALMRARASRNRLADLDAEMEQVADRTAARERRNNHLRAMVQENHENSEAMASSSMRVKKTTMSLKSEKKTVSF